MTNTEIKRTELTPEEMENVNGGLLPIIPFLILGVRTVVGALAKDADKKRRGTKWHRPKFKKGLTYK